MHPIVEFIQNENKKRRAAPHVGADTRPIRVFEKSGTNAIHIDTPPDLLLQMKTHLDAHEIKATESLSKMETHELPGGRQGIVQNWTHTIEPGHSKQNKELVDEARRHGIVSRIEK